MGIILSRFKKKKTTLEILEGLDKEMKSIEEYGQSTERQHKAVVGRLLLFSVGLYVLSACLFYFFFFPASLYDQLLYVTPLLLFPLIIVFVKRLVSWWYGRKLSRNQEKLGEIKKHKKELLEEVMDKETYKIAREILEKFAPDQLRKAPPPTTPDALVPRNNLDASKSNNRPLISEKSTSTIPPPGSPGSEIRRRTVGSSTTPLPVERLPRQYGASFTSTRVPPIGALTSANLLTRESSPPASTIPVSAPVVTDGAGATMGTAASASLPATTAFNSSEVVTAAAEAAVTTSTDAETDDETDIYDGDDDDEDNNVNDNGVEISNNLPTVAEVAGDNGQKSSEEVICTATSITRLHSLQLVRPILPKERSVMDRLVEYLVGDGVNSRYALICRNCHNHNGMALKEEFEYLAYRCCYCNFWNPSRKQRLQPPRFEAVPSSGNTTSSSAAESNTEDDEGLAAKCQLSADSKEDTKESKSEQCDRKASTSSAEEVHVARTSEHAESQSSTEAEFESLVPDHKILQAGGEDATTH